MPAGVRPKRRERNYIGKVEANLKSIYRQAKAAQAEDAEVTPADMSSIMQSAERALKALGWEPSKQGHQPSISQKERL